MYIVIIELTIKQNSHY